jgi:hypothetical protein
MRRSLLALVLFPLALTACGGSASTEPFLPGPTAKCLRDKGYTVSQDKGVDLVISSAEYGGLRASKPGGDNDLEIAFTAGPGDAQLELQAIRHTAPPRLRLRIGDITRVKRNAVLRWTIAPTSDDEQTALDCLTTS